MLPLALALAVVAGCGTECGDTVRVQSSDPGLKAAVLGLLPDIEKRAGLEARGPLRVEWRDRAQLERYLRARLDEELPPGVARWVAEVYARLGLFADTLDLRALLLAIYAEQVAGFYDPDSATLFVLRGEPGGELEAVLAHELVHALQDQHVNLDSLTARGRGNDPRVAAHAIIEGHATLVMFERMLAQTAGSPVDLADLPDLGEGLRPALEALNAQFPMLSRAPLIIREGMLFPYLGGARYVQTLWQRNSPGRPPPFGGYLPRSSEQVMDPDRALGAVRDEPTELVIELPQGARQLYSDNLGQLELSVFLRQHLGAGAAELARDWDGDRYTLFTTRRGERVLVWYSVWDHARARSRFLDGLHPVLERLPGRAAASAVEISGRPGVRLAVGNASGATVRIGNGAPVR